MYNIGYSPPRSREGILSVNVSMSGGDCRFAVPPDPGTVRIRVGFTTVASRVKWDCWCRECHITQPQPQPQLQFPSPGLLSSVVFGLPTLFLPWEVRQTSRELELLSVLVSSSRALHLHLHLHRFIILRGTDRSPEWVRLSSHYLGPTGRHRRTGGNRSVPSLIPPYT